MEMEKIKGTILAVVIVASSLLMGTASGETNTFTFVPDESTVAQTNFFGDINESYSVTGGFQLTVDINAAAAWFDSVDATLSESPNLYTRDLGQLFYMSELVGSVTSDTTIEFELPMDDPNHLYNDIHLKLTFQNSSVHLAGDYYQLMLGGSHFSIDAVAIVPSKNIYVDADATGANNGSSWADAYNYLQDALTAASSGDEIRVAQGLYKPDQGGGGTPGSREATFHLKNGVTIKGGYAGFGQPNPDVRDIGLYETILSGDLNGGDGSGFTGNSDNSRHVVTGNGTNATAVLDGFIITGGNADGIDGSWPFVNNGGGMYNEDANPTVLNCTFTANIAVLYDSEYGGQGAGMYNLRSNPTVQNCTFNGNATYGRGGGMCNYKSSPTISNCTFKGNEGGGITFHSESNGIVSNCTFINNTAGTGGGINCEYNSSPAISNCIFVGNTGSYDGGGFCCYADSNPTLINCMFSGNTAIIQHGGGMSNSRSSPTVTNCTFIGNSAGREGGGIFCRRDSNPNVTNCILWGNSAAQGNQIALWYRDIVGAEPSTAAITVSYCDVQGGAEGVHLDPNCTLNWGDGNIDADPLFIDADGADNMVGTEDDNLRLSAGSPCIDVGDNAAVPPSVLTDLDGNPRIVNSTVDMGTYEFQVIHIYVDADATGADDGSSWADAYNYLQDALFNASLGTEIRVAEGIYKPHLNSYSLAPPSSMDTFQLKNGVTVKGGYAGFGKPDPDARDIAAHETILSGDLDGNDDGFDGTGENSYHVVTGSGTDATAVLDGFTITASCGEQPDECGGVYNDSGSPTVINCTFIDNWARHGYSGNGMYSRNSSPTVTNCTFDGGGQNIAMLNELSSLTITNCIFIKNDQCGIKSYGGELKLTNCLFSDNNWAIFIDYCHPIITNCTFSRNNKVIEYDGGATATLINCIVWGNVEHLYAETVRYSCIQGSWNEGTGNIQEDPLFVDANNGDYHLQFNSPCIDTGDNSAIPPSVLTDLDGNPRIVNSTVDMGSYEFQGSQIIYVDADATGANNGSSWADAYNYLQDALFIASSGDEIRVAEGIYKPHLNSYSLAPPSRMDTFQLKNGVAIKGGYAGFGKPDPNARDIEMYETILSGDLNSNDGPNFTNNGDNNYHVVTGSGTSETAVLDGFTITSGNANGDSNRQKKGGGIYNESASPTVNNCTFISNSAAYYGGGMYNSSANPTVVNCIFKENLANDFGGGMCNEYSSPTVIDCTFSYNTSGDKGGGMNNRYDSSPTVINCIFSCNITYESGGGMANYSSSPRIVNSTFSGNYADTDGGGMYNRNRNPTLTNCIIWGNSAGEVGDQIWGGTVINYSCIQGWTGALGGTGNIGDDPRFADPNNGNYHLLPGSPCIDTGDNSVVTVATDLDGNPRIINGVVDMGAYEFYLLYVDDDASADPGPGDPEVSDPLENGTEAHPFDDIQEAINVAQEGYTVLVRPGVYPTSDPWGYSEIKFLGKNITLTSTDPTDPDIVSNTVLGCSVLFSGTESPNCTLTGFKIHNFGYGVIYGEHTHATISHCVISGNGPCGATVMKDCDGTISNCLITDNTTFSLCGVYPVIFGCNGLIKNCTIANNISGVSVGTATIENCIIYNNTGSQLGVDTGGSLNISYSNVQGGLEEISGGGTVNWGPGNIDADPRFVRLGYWEYEPLKLVEGDYHLKSEGWRWREYIAHDSHWTYDYVTSRCIDAGKPGSLLADEELTIMPDDPDNEWGVNLRINMGAFGGTGQASMPPHGWALLGDLNNDGKIDYVDLAEQAEDWLTSASEQAGDLSRDGVVNMVDFVALADDWLQAAGWVE